MASMARARGCTKHAANTLRTLGALLQSIMLCVKHALPEAPAAEREAFPLTPGQVSRAIREAECAPASPAAPLAWTFAWTFAPSLLSRMPCPRQEAARRLRPC